jgi:hypothetical protein
MLTRLYYIGGTVLLLGYVVVAWEGWEFANPIRVSPVPPAGANLTSSARYHSSSSRSVWFFSGGK